MQTSIALEAKVLPPVGAVRRTVERREPVDSFATLNFTNSTVEAERFWVQMEFLPEEHSRVITSFSTQENSHLLGLPNSSLAQALFAVSKTEEGRRFLADFLPTVKNNFQSLSPEELLSNFSEQTSGSRTSNIPFSFLNGLKSGVYQFLVTKSQPPLSILSLNVWGGPPVVGGLMPERFGEIGRRIQASGSDIVALQELWKKETNDALYNINLPHGVLTDDRRKLLDGTGLAILSRYPIVASSYLEFQITKWLPIVKKGALYASIDVPNLGKVNVINVHLYSQKDGPNVRLAQATELAKWIKSIAAPNCPTVILGDFNANLQSDALTHLEQAGFIDTFTLANGTMDSPTFDIVHNTWARRTTFFTRDRDPRKIDHILLGDTSDLPRSTIESKLLFTEPDFNGKHLSDHYGVQCQLRVA